MSPQEAKRTMPSHSAVSPTTNVTSPTAERNERRTWEYGDGSDGGRSQFTLTLLVALVISVGLAVGLGVGLGRRGGDCGLDPIPTSPVPSGAGGSSLCEEGGSRPAHPPPEFAHAQQRVKLTAGVDAAPRRYFGASVALSGDAAAVGAPSDSDDFDAAAAYVYRRSAETGAWGREGRLVLADVPREGHSVALDGDTAVVGAKYYVKNPDGTTSRGSGPPLVFRRSGDVWLPEARLEWSWIPDHFGWSVAVSNDTALVGALGAAFAFRRSGASWAGEAQLRASESKAGDRFGESVAIDGETAVVGAAQGDADGPESGGAFVFRRSGAAWSEEARLAPGDPGRGHHFGTSVDVSGDTSLVGAWGSAHVFRRSETTWVEEARLVASGSQDGFGSSVSIDGNTALVGAYSNDDKGLDSGAVHVFQRSGASWMEVATLYANDTNTGAGFGYSVAVNKNSAIVGAPLDDGGGTDSGAAYIFDFTYT